jgi:hypothetical protein
MSKISTTLCAFVLGVFCGILFNGLAQVNTASRSSQEIDNLKTNPIVISGGRVFGLGTGVLIGGAIPTFLSIEQVPTFKDITISGTSSQPLDGLDCRGCTFNDTVLKYSGGAYNLEGAKITGTTHLVLEGAAANTVAFLEFMHGIASGVPSASFPPNRPIERRAIAKKPMTKMDFTAPFIGAK